MFARSSSVIVARARAVRDLHRGDLGGDRDGLGERADFQRQLAEIADLGARQIDVGDGQRPEAGKLDAERVAPRSQRWESKQPRDVRDDGFESAPVLASVGVHRRAWNRGAADVDDGAYECAASASALRERGACACQKEHDNDDECLRPRVSCPSLHSFLAVVQVRK